MTNDSFRSAGLRSSVAASVLLAGAAALLQGCAHHQPKGPEIGSANSRHMVEIMVMAAGQPVPPPHTVDGTLKFWTCIGKQTRTICIDEEPIDLRKAGAEREITWRVTSGDLRFAKEAGIALDEGEWDVKPGGEGNIVVARLRVTPTTPRYVKYEMRLEGPGGTERWDPTIMN